MFFAFNRLINEKETLIINDDDTFDEKKKYLEIKREEVYITNIVKCRPPQNRVPNKEEATACMDYLRSQVMLVKPKIIVLLGSTALKSILGEEYGITKTRGIWIEMYFIYANIPPSSIIKR